MDRVGRKSNAWPHRLQAPSSPAMSCGVRNARHDGQKCGDEYFDCASAELPLFTSRMYPGRAHVGRVRP